VARWAVLLSSSSHCGCNTLVCSNLRHVMLRASHVLGIFWLRGGCCHAPSGQHTHTASQSTEQHT
jgi:hypothetical protein